MLRTWRANCSAGIKLSECRLYKIFTLALIAEMATAPIGIFGVLEMVGKPGGVVDHVTAFRSLAFSGCFLFIRGEIACPKRLGHAWK